MIRKNQSIPSLSWAQVSAFRLVRHHFLDLSPANLVAVSRDVCGIQAQVASAAEMSLWARIPSLTRPEIHAALRNNRTLIKTSLMRQTLHWIPAVDFSAYISALRNSRLEAVFRMLSRFGVTHREVEAMNAIVVEALRNGPLTQQELRARVRPEVGKHIHAWMEKIWNAFRPAIVEGLICYGPDRGRQVTYIRVDHWLPKQKNVAEEAAKQILLRRFLGAYGPATLQDFSKWSGISMKEAIPVWQSVKEELAEVSIEGEKGFIHRKDLKFLRQSGLDEPVLRLLPAFDTYLLAHAQKDHLVDASHYKKIYRSAGWISPVVLLNGRVVGTWSHTRQRKAMLLNVVLFKTLSKNLRSRIEEEAESLGTFLQTPCHVSYSK